MASYLFRRVHGKTVVFLFFLKNAFSLNINWPQAGATVFWRFLLRTLRRITPATVTHSLAEDNGYQRYMTNKTDQSRTRREYPKPTITNNSRG
jgi:hypothetical protein